MGNPGSSPLNKWKPQSILHQTNAKMRNPGQFTASRASMCCCAIFFVMNLTSMHACPHKHTCMCTHTYVCMYAHAHTHTHTHLHSETHTHTGELSQVIIYFSGEWSTLLPLTSLPLLFIYLQQKGSRGCVCDVTNSSRDRRVGVD